MIYKTVNNFEEFSKLENNWNKIFISDNKSKYFNSFRYCRTWVKETFDLSNKIFVIIALHNKNIVGIAPLQIYTEKKIISKKRTLQFICKGDYQDFLVLNDEHLNKEKILSTLFDGIYENKILWDQIYFPLIAKQSNLYPFFLKRKKFIKKIKYLTENAFLDVTEKNDFKDLNISNSKNKHFNRFLREIDYDLIVNTDNIIDQIAKVHIDQKNFMKESGKLKRRSYYENKSIYNFLNKLYENNNSVLTYILKDNKNNNIISFETGYLHKGVFHSYNIGFNPRYEKYRMGYVLKKIMIDENFSSKRWNVIDMGPGVYDWKFFLTSDSNSMFLFNDSNSNIASFLYLIEKKLLNIFNSTFNK